ncbi:MAG: aminotransferase class V-fold PLP-dependent enzyme [Bacteroidota bacterium]|nr:aminotransferase class V-fold PLP-dependent enzyme [Bacteroidota bacterium]
MYKDAVPIQNLLHARILVIFFPEVISYFSNGLVMAEYNLSLYRSWFPHIVNGSIWMNHAAISPLSTRVNTAVQKYLEARTTGEIDVYLSMLPTVAHLKQNIGTLINAAPERIGFVLNTSEGLSVLASGLEWKPGDRILLNESEFPANVVPFLNLRRHGVEIDFIKIHHGAITPEITEQYLTSKTKLVSVSFVQFLSGFRADLAAIGALCKKRGIIFSVDGIQGLGVSPLDVQKMKIDFLSSGGNKWLMGLMGLAFIYVSEEMQNRIQQSHMGWTSNRNFFSEFFKYRVDLDDTARRYENGTQNYIAIAALGASLATLLEVGIENIQSHVAALTEKIIAAADGAGHSLVTSRDKNERAGIVTFRCENADELFAFLKKEHITVSVREGMIRVSPHFYNSSEDVAALHSALLQYKKSA